MPYILWNPTSDKPPKKVFKTQEHAESTAKWAANKNPEDKFFVCELKTYAVIDGASIEPDIYEVDEGTEIK